MPTTVGKILTYYRIEPYLLKINKSACCFPGKFMNFSDAATGGILRKKLF